MLTITIPSIELFDEVTNTFTSSKEQALQLEHSLVSLSKWESKWCKPFLTKEDKTFDEGVDYIKCMTLTQNVPQEAYNGIDLRIIAQVSEYIEAPMTATTLKQKQKRANTEVITGEIIYWWMISFGIPMECQKWHLNRLLTLINVCSIKNDSGEKMSKNEILARNKAENAARKARIGTTG